MPDASPNPVIVIVEDDSEVLNLLRRVLENEQFPVAVARDENEALWVLRRVAAKGVPLLTVVDLHLPFPSGSQILSFIRTHRDLKKTPILAISSRGALEVRIKALEEGADDFLEKPFSNREFIARIRMLIRRYQEPATAKIPPVSLTIGPLSLDTQRMEVFVADQEVRLTRVEFQILHFLGVNQGRIVSKEDLLNTLWGADNDVGEEILKVHISALRKKLGDSSHEPRYIETIRGFGYRLKKSVSAPS